MGIFPTTKLFQILLQELQHKTTFKKHETIIDSLKNILVVNYECYE